MAQENCDTAMPLADSDKGKILFEHPRHLGPGVDVFDSKNKPVTPIIRLLQPDTYPSKLMIDDVASDELRFFESARRTFSRSISQDFGSSDSQYEVSTRLDDRSFSVFARRSFSDSRGLQHNLRRILILGSPSLLTIHVIARLLKASHHVRLFYRHYRGKAILRVLSKLIKTRPSRLSFFYEDDLSQAVVGCDGVVYIDGPDTSDASSEEEIIHRYESSIQDLFLSLRSHGKSIRRVVMITPASACFPVETTMIPREKRLRRAQEVSLKEAERLSDKSGVPLTLLLPSMIVGSSLIGECDGNVQALANFAKQRRFYTSPIYFNFVDVRDVAEACELSLSSPAAEHQRYILSAGELSLTQIASIIKRCIPSLNPPEYELPAVLVKALSLSGVVGLAGFEFYERTASDRLGTSYPLSCLKVQRDLGLQLRSAPFAVMDALATALNVPAAMPQSCIAITCTDFVSAKETKKMATNVNRGLVLSALCALFGLVGYSGGMYIFSPRMLT